MPDPQILKRRGAALRVAMLDAGLRPAAVGRALGVTPQQITNMREGRSDTIRHSQALSRLLGKPLEYFIAPPADIIRKAARRRVSGSTAARPARPRNGGGRQC